jgi:hypothetical protein
VTQGTSTSTSKEIKINRVEFQNMAQNRALPVYRTVVVPVPVQILVPVPVPVGMSTASERPFNSQARKYACLPVLVIFFY